MQQQRTTQHLTESSDGVVSDFWVEYLSVDIRHADAVAENVAADHDVVFSGRRRRPTYDDGVGQRPDV